MKKLIISSDTLKPALSKLGHVIESDSVLPALKNIYCRVTPGQLELIGTNMAITIFYRLECEAKEEFEFLLSYRFINKIVTLNKHCPLEIEAGKEIRIKGPNDVYEIKVAEKIKDFPKLPELPVENSFPVGSDILTTLHTALATIGKAEANPRFTFVLMELAAGKITIASTDGSYMVFSKEFESEMKDVQELLFSQKLIKVLEGCEEVKIFYNDKTIGFEAGNITIINTRSEEKFVNYRNVFPADWPGNLTVQKDVLIEALTKCSMVDDQLRATKLDISDTEVKLQSDDHLLQVNVSVPIAYKGEVKAAVVNSEKLLKLLNQIEHDEITFAIHDSKRAIILTSSEDAGYKGMIMPLASSN